MKYRKLRIAWSVAWGVVTVLLIVLWVRSYWWADRLYVPLTDGHTMLIGSISGGVAVAPWGPPATRFASSQMFRSEKHGEPPPELIHSGLSREKLALIAQHEGFWAELINHPLRIRFGILGHTFLSPYFVLVGCASLIAALSWFRFSLRTLLIAITLVAVGMGLIVLTAK